MADGTGPPFEVGDHQHVYDPSVGEAERWYLNDHTIFRDHDGLWHLVGITHAEPFAPFDEVDLAHATAGSLLGPWIKHPAALTADPAHGEHHLWAPHVLEHDGRFWMYYCAGGDAPDRYRIHLATSEDGWSWERHEANPLLVDGYEARDPMVLRVDDRWLMYYTATSSPEGGHHVVVAAESDDLVHWSGRHVVYEDELEGTGAGPTESPFVVARDGTYYLFLGPDFAELMSAIEEAGGAYGPAARAAYRRTRVLASADPLSFRAEDQVATVASHAAEVVVDGCDWWVTHCGWGEGGVSLAPLRWRDR